MHAGIEGILEGARRCIQPGPSQRILQAVTAAVATTQDSTANIKDLKFSVIKSNCFVVYVITDKSNASSSRPALPSV